MVIGDRVAAFVFLNSLSLDYFIFTMIKVFLKSLCLICSFISRAVMNTSGQMVRINANGGAWYSGDYQLCTVGTQWMK